MEVMILQKVKIMENVNVGGTRPGKESTKRIFHGADVPRWFLK